MKKAALIILTLLIGATAFGEIYNYLTVKVDGKTVSFPLESVESVTFTVDDLSSEPTDPEADYTLRVLTFEDADYRGEANYLGIANWSSLIDSPQYGGPLLYGDFTGTDYGWCDTNNTWLSAAIDPDNDGNVFWNGGEAVSNYIEPDYAKKSVDSNSQLAAPTGGHNGSKNFCVHNGYFDDIMYDSPRGGIRFADGTARIIDHMYVCLTSYGLSVGLLGNRFCPAATPADWVELVAIGVHNDGTTSETTLKVCEKGSFVSDWQRWDLSALGEVVRLDFNIKSSMTGEYGLNFPAYFAYDDIAVRFPNN